MVNATPRPLYPWERPCTHCIGGWVGPRAGLDGYGKSRPTQGFDPRTVQPVPSRYTDRAIPAHKWKRVIFPDTFTLSVRPLILHSVVTCHPSDHHSVLTVPETVMMIVPNGIIADMYCVFLQLEFCEEMCGLACSLEVSLIRNVNTIFNNNPLRENCISVQHPPPQHTGSINTGTDQLECDGTRAETRFSLSAQRTSPFKLAGASVRSTTGSRGVRISGSNVSNVGYTMFRGSAKGTGYPLYSPVSPSLSLPCVTVCHHISSGVYIQFVWIQPLYDQRFLSSDLSSWTTLSSALLVQRFK